MIAVFLRGELESEREHGSALCAYAEGGDVVLEGHARLTAIALEPNVVPDAAPVLRGVSPRIPGWCQYVLPEG